MVIPSDQSYLPKVEKFVMSVCKRAMCTRDQTDNIAIAVTELVNNSIIHGNKFSPNKTVTIEAVLYEDRLTLSVTDQGKGFDPRKLANPTDPENLWKQGGRGIFLVKNLIDEVEIYPTVAGTTVKLTEYFSQS